MPGLRAVEEAVPCLFAAVDGVHLGRDHDVADADVLRQSHRRTDEEHCLRLEP